MLNLHIAVAVSVSCLFVDVAGAQDLKREKLPSGNNMGTITGGSIDAPCYDFYVHVVLGNREFRQRFCGPRASTRCKKERDKLANKTECKRVSAQAPVPGSSSRPGQTIPDSGVCYDLSYYPGPGLLSITHETYCGPNSKNSCLSVANMRNDRMRGMPGIFSCVLK